MRATTEHTGVDFQQLFEATPDPYLILSARLTIIGVNDAYLNATLTKREHIINRYLFEVFPDNPDDPMADGVSNLSASLSHVLQYRQAHKMPVQKYDIRRHDGTFEERYWSPLNTPVLNGDELECIIHRVEDVTDMERMNQAISKQQEQLTELDAKVQVSIENYKKSEARFFKIFDFCPITVYMTDMATGRFLHVNKAFEDLFGMKAGDVIGKTTVELNITDTEKRAEAANAIKKEGRISGLELTLKVANGELRNMLMSAEIIESDNIPCFLVAMIDITENRKQHDSILVLNKELEAFTYSVSHDLRTPLRAINGYAQMLTEDYDKNLDAEGKRFLSIISKNAVKMGRLIDELLALSRLGKKELNKKDTDMNDLMEHVLIDTIINTNEQAICTADIRIGELGHVKSDPILMKQVMINLLNNAIKYSSKKEQPIVEVNSVLNGDEVVFSIKDNGVGFDMRYVDKLFGVFQRLHTSDEFEGNGVGLAIVQRIIHKHGGRVWAEGVLNEGATFYFTLPAHC